MIGSHHKNMRGAWLLRERQLQPEGAPPSLSPCPELAFHRLGDLLGNSQAKASAGDGAVSVQSLERLEDACQVVVMEAHAGVTYDEAHPADLLGRFDGADHAAALDVVLHRIAEQVQQDLPCSLRVGVHRDVIEGRAR